MSSRRLWLSVLMAAALLASVAGALALGSAANSLGTRSAAVVQGGGGSNPSGGVVDRDLPSAGGPAQPLAESGGSATTTGGGSVDGSNLGSSSPLPAADAATQQAQRDADNESAPTTPIDPSAPVVPAPDVPETKGQTAPDLSGSAAPAAPDLTPSSFVFERNSDLGANAGIIGETTNASNGPVVLETWNWGAARSNDLGQTWTYYNPATLFPSVSGGFCCDQVAYYDQNHDTMFWIMQYSNDASGNNAIRIAWAKGQSDLKAMHFCYTNLTAQQLGSTAGPSGTNYDQPKFARSDNDVYLDIQRYGTVGGATIIRIPNSEFSTYPTCNGVNYQWYAPPTTIYSPGFVQRANSVMYFAAHVSTTQLRVFSWPESAADWTGITSHDVSHTGYWANYPNRCPRTGGSATSDWCQRRSFGGGWAHSDRIFSGWVANGLITFMWDSTQTLPGSIYAGSFPTRTYPFVDVVRISESTFALNSQPTIFSSINAWVYASAAKNDRGDAAGTLMWGGGSFYEYCATWIWDAFTPDPLTHGWEVYFPHNSNSDPNDTLSGDYFGTRRNGFNGNTWGGACYSLVNSTSTTHPYYMWFGRFGDFHDTLLPLIRR